MTSMTLSKNTIKKAFGGGLSSSECQINIDTGYPQRPKTAVPGKRRPLTDKPPRSEGLSTKADDHSINEKKSGGSRPKTSYSNRRLSLSNDAVKQKPVNDESSGENTIQNTNLEKALEDIDIVEYFYDKSIKDIFPLSEDHIDKYNNNQKVPFGNRHFYEGTNTSKKSKSIISDFERNTSRLQRKKIYNHPFSNDTDVQTLAIKTNKTPLKKSELESKVLSEGQFEKDHILNNSYNSNDLFSFQRKSNSLKENTVTKNDLRRRLHSDTEVSDFFKKSSDHIHFASIKPQVTQEVKPLVHQSSIKDHGVWLKSSKYVSLGAHRETDCKVIAKYADDLRLVDHNTRYRGDRNRQKLFDYSAEKSDAFQYKTNKFPRKLKPIPGSDNLRLIDKDT